MSETWTEYALHFPKGHTSSPLLDRETATNHAAIYVAAGIEATIVGRQVTASPWLPVEDQPGGAA